MYTCIKMKDIIEDITEGKEASHLKLKLNCINKSVCFFSIVKGLPKRFVQVMWCIQM